jgi:hypothetical protein
MSDIKRGKKFTKKEREQIVFLASKQKANPPISANWNYTLVMFDVNKIYHTCLPLANRPADSCQNIHETR